MGVSQYRLLSLQSPHRSLKGMPQGIPGNFAKILNFNFFLVKIAIICFILCRKSNVLHPSGGVKSRQTREGWPEKQAVY